jgi:hypothetical protein
MKNQTVLKDIFGRTDSCGIVIFRRKQRDHFHYASRVCFIQTKSSYEFEQPVVSRMNARPVRPEPQTTLSN